METLEDSEKLRCTTGRLHVNFLLLQRKETRNDRPLFIASERLASSHYYQYQARSDGRSCRLDSFVHLSDLVFFQMQLHDLLFRYSL
jgi:hypothetical protein